MWGGVPDAVNHAKFHFKIGSGVRNFTTSVLAISSLGALNMYRVAQNKIPHQTICNISATSGLISKILEAA